MLSAVDDDFTYIYFVIRVFAMLYFLSTYLYGQDTDPCQYQWKGGLIGGVFLICLVHPWPVIATPTGGTVIEPQIPTHG